MAWALQLLQVRSLSPGLFLGFLAAPGGKELLAGGELCRAKRSCFRLLVHCDRRAASRAAWTAGSSSAISTAMMAMTTRSSISVNPRRDVDLMGWSSRGARMDENG